MGEDEIPPEMRSEEDSVQQYVREEVSSSLLDFFKPFIAVLPESKRQNMEGLWERDVNVIRSRRRMPLPIGAGQPRDVGPLARVGWILGVMVGIALAFGLLIAGIEALTPLVR